MNEENVLKLDHPDYFNRNLLTWDNIVKMEQQNPPKKAVMHIILTDVASTVRSQDKLQGAAARESTRLRPWRIAAPPAMPPKRAPGK